MTAENQISALDLNLSILLDFVVRATYVLVSIGLILGQTFPIRIGFLSTSIVEVLVATAIGLAVLTTNSKDRKSAYLFLLIAATPMLIVSATHNPIDRVLRDFTQIAFVGLYIVGTTIKKKQFVESLALAIFIVAPIAVRYGISEDIYFFQAPLATQVLFNLRIPSMFIFAVILSEFVRGHTRLWHLAFLVCLAVLAASIRTRGFHLALLFELAVAVAVLVRTRVRHKYLVSVLSIVAILAIVLAFASLPAIQERYSFILGAGANGLSAFENDPSLAARLILWGIALSELGTDIWRHLFGLGFGTYLLLDPRGIGDYQYLPAWMIHNQLLSIYVTGGAYLVLIFGWFLRKLYSMARDKELFLIMCVGTILYSLSTPVLGKVIDASMSWIFLGLAVGASRGIEIGRE